MSWVHVSDSSDNSCTVCAMTQQSGSLPGGGGRGCDVLGDSASGANTFSVGSGVDGSGDDIPMGLGENSEVNSGRGIRPSGGLGRPREEVAGAGREQGAPARSLEELMAMILQNAGQRDRQCADTDLLQAEAGTVRR